MVNADIIVHGRRGWTKKNHKHISKKISKNGKWVYEYDNNSLEDIRNEYNKEAMSKVPYDFQQVRTLVKT